MGTCFGCCSKNYLKKPTCKRKILYIGGSQRLPQDEEFLELEQRNETGVEILTECKDSGAPTTSKLKKLKLKKPNFKWLRNENQMLSGALHHIRNMKSPADSVMPLLNRNNSFADTISNAGSQKWDQLSNGATPGSSVDLEWENELGFNSSPNFGANEEMQWTAQTENTTNNSWRSSPLSNSNGLEWDGDFNSVDVSEIIAETQKLTADIEDNIERTNITTNLNDLENNN